ncbi:odorant receptor 67c-like [Fopius arisanus]|uniref:Odorant receptor n=1 Tax=Fopius arisanus TaxID=64838 RepID=A0A9R1T3Q2_9HYME|nr:PREDICTED: odorant receptor 67c-like [Fopius arisanus]
MGFYQPIVESVKSKCLSVASRNHRSLDKPIDLEIDFDDEVKYLRKSMKSLGIWPFPYRRKWIILCIVSFLLSTVLPLTTKTYFTDWKNERCPQLLTVIFMEFVTTKVLIFKIHRRNVQGIFEFMKSDWERAKYLTPERKNLMLESVKQSQFILKILTVVFATAFTFTAIRPWLTSYIHQKPITFYADVWHPFTLSPISGVIMILEITTSLWTVVAFVSLEAYFIILAKHCCAQLKILGSTIEQYKGRTLHNIPAERYNCACTGCVVTRHVEIMQFFKSIKKSFNLFLSANLLAIQTYGIVTVIISFQQTGSTSTFFLTICGIFAILGFSTEFLFCDIGDKLRQESLNLGDAVFNSQWYDFKRTDAKSYLMTMMISKNMPMQLTAGAFFTVSLKLFKECVFLVLSVFSLFRSINEKKNRELMGL